MKKSKPLHKPHITARTLRSRVCTLLLMIWMGCVLAGGATISSNEVAGAHREQVKELEQYLDRQITTSEAVRAKSWNRNFKSIDAYEKSIAPKRDELWRLLGGKPERSAPLSPKEELIGEFETHSAWRVWLGAFDSVRVYGILLVPKMKERAPALICIHGMGGSPEAVCGLAEKPDYHNNFGLEAVKRGYVVFAPLDVNTQKDRRWLDRKALLVGTRLQSLEQFKVVRVIDYLASRKEVDPKCIGAYGISWGGRTVMNAAALDRRIAACAISGHFNHLVPKMVTPSTNYTAFIETQEDYAFFYGHFLKFTDADVVSMICPRPVFIEQGRRDRVAHWRMSQQAFQPVKAIYHKLGIGERAVYSIFEGPHEVHGVEAFQFFDRWLKPRQTAFRLNVQVTLRSARCSQAPATLEYDFGKFDPHSVRMTPQVPFRVETFFGSSQAKVHFVVPNKHTTNFTISFETRGGDRHRYNGLVGDGDYFREEFGRREIAPSHFDAMADLDNDGDLDLFKGGVEPFVYGYENVGRNRFVERGRLPFKLPCSRDNRSWVTVAFYDIDNDGDQDFFPSFGDGPDAGKIIFYRNAGQLKFERVDVLTTASGTPLAGGAQAGGWFPSITFVRGWDGADSNRLDALVGSNHRCWLYRGGPGFADAEPIDVGTLVNPRFDVADIDKDGDLDLFAGTQPGAVHFFENIGTRSQPVLAKGRIVAWTGKYLIGDAHSGIALADFDRDGRLDILSGRFWERTDLNHPEQPRDFGGLFRNRFPDFVRDHRSGPFTEQFQICDAVRQNCVRATDWDRDGKLDLLAGDTDGFIWFFRNRGGVFAKGERLPFSVANSGGHARLDISGPDLLVADGSGTISLFSKKGTEKLPIQLRSRASLLVCDWNSDGRKDLVLADEKGYYIAIDGKDRKPILFGGRKVSYVRPNLGSFVDWDGDGKKDLIGCHFENTIRFYRNIGTATVPEFADPEGLTILKAESPQMISGADVIDWNGDGDLDILTGQGHGGSGLRFYERDWLENELAATHPLVTVLSVETNAQLSLNRH